MLDAIMSFDQFIYNKWSIPNIVVEIPVMCNESGNKKFPFSYLEHVILLTLALAQLRGRCFNKKLR